MNGIRLFAGYDLRESIGYHTFCQSAIEQSSVPISITPLSGEQRDGSNSFTYSRFLVPHLCDFRGWAIFADGSDMLFRADPAELDNLRLQNHRCPVFVVKHDYQTKHARKYIGTELEAPNENYPRKNWSSLVIWDCGHALNRKLTREFVQHQTGAYLHRFAWLPDELIGELPIEWNWLADEYGHSKQAKLLHWTAGIPGFSYYKDSPHSDEWRAVSRRVVRGLP